MSAVTTEQDPPRTEGTAEDEPLLGRAGDASQQEGRGLQFNFVLGTAIIAQVGIWILTATIWASIFVHPKALGLFSAHPLLNSSALLLTTQAILVLQPTHTKAQKTTGAHIHAALNITSILALLAAFIIIEWNKFAHDAPHFTSVHGKLGLIAYILFYIQALVGFTQYYTPGLYGGVDNAKAVYKYHRVSGYVLLTLGLATVAAATQTETGRDTLGLKLWAVLVAAVITLVGVLPRIRKQKFGL